MCLIAIKETANEQLNDLCNSGSDGKRLEKNLFRYADAADINNPGVLDATECHMHSMHPKLKAIRRKRFGRHRVFWTGQHSLCKYHAIYIKVFKKAGTEDKQDKGF